MFLSSPAILYICRISIAVAIRSLDPTLERTKAGAETSS